MIHGKIEGACKYKRGNGMHIAASFHTLVHIKIPLVSCFLTMAWEYWNVFHSDIWMHNRYRPGTTIHRKHI
jgi:hypothetical protein